MLQATHYVAPGAAANGHRMTQSPALDSGFGEGNEDDLEGMLGEALAGDGEDEGGLWGSDEF